MQNIRYKTNLCKKEIPGKELSTELDDSKAKQLNESVHC